MSLALELGGVRGEDVRRVTGETRNSPFVLAH